MTFIHEKADINDDVSIGENTRIWQYVVILSEAKIGSECNICAHTLIEGDVIIGDRVTVKSGVQLWDGTRVANDVFIGPNVTFTNDPFPRSKEHPEVYSGITIKEFASIGANATLLPGITIGDYCMVGAGSVVTKDTPPYSVLVGNPAKIIRYLNK